MTTSADLEIPFAMVGGHLALNFTNTVNARSGEFPYSVTNERLKNFTRLLAWGRKAELLEEGELQILLEEAEAHPEEVEAELARAIALREAIYRLVVSAEAGLTVPETELALLNAVLAEAMAHLQLAPEETGFRWELNTGKAGVNKILWPVVRAAAELLVSDDLSRVKHCGGENCGWLFLDLSRNHSRQWCNMQDCGNRAKARRHYQRKRGAPA